jgi:type II secretory pathway component GspD/PulD (secretin)
MARQFVEEEEGQRDLFVHTCRYIQGSTLRSALDNFISPVGMLADCGEADKVVIYDDKDTIPVLRKIAEELDQPVPQVLVGARVVEFTVDSGFEKELALQYQKFVDITDMGASTDFVDKLTAALVPAAPTLGSAGYMSYDSDEQDLLSGFLRFLESNGKSQILSAPNLILRRGVSGNILTGEDVPIVESSTTSSGISYSTKYKSVGVKLQVTPVMIVDGYVRLEISPEVSNITRYEESQNGVRSPVIAVRNANTELVVKDGQLVSIGGLLREEVLEERSRVPILGSIPLLGTLFRSTTHDSVQSQLVIFLTTKILKDEDMTPSLIEPSKMTAELQAQIDIIEQTMPEQKHSMGDDVRKLCE